MILQHDDMLFRASELGFHNPHITIFGRLGKLASGRRHLRCIEIFTYLLAVIPNF